MAKEYARHSPSASKRAERDCCNKGHVLEVEEVLRQGRYSWTIEKYPVANAHPNKIKEEISEKVRVLRWRMRPRLLAHQMVLGAAS